MSDFIFALALKLFKKKSLEPSAVTNTYQTASFFLYLFIYLRLKRFHHKFAFILLLKSPMYINNNNFPWILSFYSEKHVFFFFLIYQFKHYMIFRFIFISICFLIFFVSSCNFLKNIQKLYKVLLCFSFCLDSCFSLLSSTFSSLLCFSVFFSLVPFLLLPCVLSHSYIPFTFFCLSLLFFNSSICFFLF